MVQPGTRGGSSAACDPSREDDVLSIVVADTAALSRLLVRLIRRSLRQKRLAELGSCGTRMFVAITITITIRHWIAHTPEEYAGGGKAQTSKW